MYRARLRPSGLSLHEIVIKIHGASETFSPAASVNDSLQNESERDPPLLPRKTISKFRKFSLVEKHDFPANIIVEKGENPSEVLDAFLRKLARVHGKTKPVVVGTTHVLDFQDGMTVRISNVGSLSGIFPINVTSPSSTEERPIEEVLSEPPNLVVNRKEFDALVERVKRLEQTRGGDN